MGQMLNKARYVVGISAFYHDSACCILRDGKIIAAAEEERFSRIKNDSSLPVQAFRFCLSDAGISIADIDALSFYENPWKKLSRQIWSDVFHGSWERINSNTPARIENEIREKLRYEKKIFFFDHHMSHAASAFHFSGFEQAAILTVDGVGEWATTTYGIGSANKIDLFDQVEFPNSLGMLYSTITSFLGFKVNSGEYKVMGLAPYGAPKFLKHLEELFSIEEKGQYVLNMEYFDFINGKEMYSEKLVRLLGIEPRGHDEPVTQAHKDIANSLQTILESVLLKKVNFLYEKTKVPNLCMAGGVALNCVANGKILRQGPFKQLFVQPAANDAGGALGAAALAHLTLEKSAAVFKPITDMYFGPDFTNNAIARVLKASGINFKHFENDVNELINQTVKRLADGKIVGWFHGKMEFGPRALGNRSILADPRDPTMRDKINALVKKREAFRPFAPVVLEGKASAFFDIDHKSPFMLETCSVISDTFLPAITHVDLSARVQTVNENCNELLARLLIAFEKQSGIPILLNTSFNVNKEPIVCTPEDALRCFIIARLDCLVIGEYIVDRSSNDLLYLEKFFDQNWMFEEEYSTNNLYTFL
jgi:carbamoyltransferase